MQPLTECAVCGDEPTRIDLVTKEKLCDKDARSLFGTGWEDHTEPLAYPEEEL